MRERPDPDVAASIMRRWRLVAGLACVGALVGFIGSLAMPRTYQASASLLVGQFASGNVTINDVKATQSLAATYADVARREPVMEAVVNDLKLDTSWRALVKSVHTKIPREDPQVIDITVDASSPQAAERIASRTAANIIAYANAQTSAGSTFMRDELAALETDIREVGKRLAELRKQDGANAADDSALVKEINDVSAQLSQDQQNYAEFRAMAYPASSAQVSLLDSAHAGTSPIRPNVRFNTIIVGFVGLVLGVATAYLLATRRRHAVEASSAIASEPDAPPSVEQPLVDKPSVDNPAGPALVRHVAVPATGSGPST